MVAQGVELSSLDKKQSEGAEMKPKEMGRAKTIMLHLVPEAIILVVAVGLLYGFKMYLA